MEDFLACGRRELSRGQRLGLEGVVADAVEPLCESEELSLEGLVDGDVGRDCADERIYREGIRDLLVDRVIIALKKTSCRWIRLKSLWTSAFQVPF